MSFIEDFAPKDELPLKGQMPPCGGMCSIFRKVGCVGDSLASGEFEVKDGDKPTVYLDMYEHSWGQHLARICGSKVYNFSRGGMTASEYLDGFAEQNGFWSRDLACDAYIVGLGVNDLFGRRQRLGSVGDVHDDWHENADTFAGRFGELLARLREIQPDSVIFLVTMPRGDDGESDERKSLTAAHRDLMYDFAERFKSCYVIDLYRYAPPHDKAYKELFYMHGHLNPAGYRIAAEQIVSYIDYIVRHDPQAFAEVGLIGTEYYGKNPKPAVLA